MASPDIERIPITSEEQWHALRAQDVTASEVAALFGLHPYRTVGELHARKSGVELPDPGESSVIRRGRALEAVVAAEVARVNPSWRIEKAADYWRDSKHRLGATPDFYVRDGERAGILQTKTVASSVFRRSWAEDQPPFWISLQATVEAALTDAEFAAVAALVVGDFTFDLHVYDIPRHAASERRIRDAVDDFWRHVESGEQPSIDYERDGPLLAVLYPRETPGKVVDLRADNRIVELLEERERLSASVDHIKGALEACSNEIKAKLGDAEAALVTGWRVTFKEQHRKEFTVRATSYRVLRVTPDKEQAALLRAIKDSKESAA